jgi:hypothetical protein
MFDNGKFHENTIRTAHVVQGISFTIFKNMCDTSDVHVLEVEAMSDAILAKQLGGVQIMKEDPKTNTQELILRVQVKKTIDISTTPL